MYHIVSVHFPGVMFPEYRNALGFAWFEVDCESMVVKVVIDSCSVVFDVFNELFVVGGVYVEYYVIYP